jgi:hypothetical protein
MNKADFNQLRSTAEELRPLTQSTSIGAAIWDGTKYVRGDVKAPDAFALAWWSILNTIADLLEAQDSPLSDNQINYLTRVLFGGMGSFNDLFFDPKFMGDAANAINERLAEKRHLLFKIFNTRGS